MVRALTYGRAGNFYFQVAASIGYSLKHGLGFSVNNSTADKFHNPLYLQHLVNPNWNQNLERVIINEKHFHYEEIPFDESYRNKNVILNGYWQSHRYFLGYEEKIISLFNYPWHLENDVCSIHARFGDYLTIPGKHIIVTTEYLEKAIAFVQRTKGIKRFKVFSDDLNYFREHFRWVYDFEYSTNTTIEEDLIEISCCHSNINSSSTFSWWSAFLNRNSDKMVVTPMLWFQEGWRDDHGIVNTSDLVPSTWFKI